MAGSLCLSQLDVLSKRLKEWVRKIKLAGCQLLGAR